MITLQPQLAWGVWGGFLRAVAATASGADTGVEIDAFVLMTIVCETVRTLKESRGQPGTWPVLQQDHCSSSPPQGDGASGIAGSLDIETIVLQPRRSLFLFTVET